MTLQFNRKQTIAIIAAFVFAAIIILFVYFKMYLPAVSKSGNKAIGTENKPNSFEPPANQNHAHE